MSKSSKGLLANCVVDQQLFEQTPNGKRLTCSPECKKKWDVELRRRAKFAGRMQQYRRLRELLGLNDDEVTESSMLRKQLANQDHALLRQGRAIIGLFLTTTLFLVLWIAK